MATVYFTSKFVLDQMSGVHNFATDTIKIALFNGSASISQATETYSSLNEVITGGGYTTGGATMSVSATYPKYDGTRASVRFDDVAWTFTNNKPVKYALVYNASKSNAAIMVFDFGNQRTYTGAFTLSFPLTQDALVCASTAQAS